MVSRPCSAQVTEASSNALPSSSTTFPFKVKSAAKRQRFADSNRYKRMKTFRIIVLFITFTN